MEGHNFSTASEHGPAGLKVSSMRWPEFAATITLGDLAEAGAVIVAALAIRMEIKRSKEGAKAQRLVQEDELRWRRADAARTLLTDIHHQHLAADAIRLLDWGDKPQRYVLPIGDSVTITMPLVRRALADSDSEDPAVLYVKIVSVSTCTQASFFWRMFVPFWGRTQYSSRRRSSNVPNSPCSVG
jgi:hypothetical protein